MLAAIRRHKVITALAVMAIAVLLAVGISIAVNGGPGYHTPQNGYGNSKPAY